MRKLTFSLIAGAVALAAGGAAFAQAAGAERPPMTRAVAEQRSARAFDRLDANHDGKLDPGDRAERRKAHFDRLDADKDGSLSYAEFDAAPAPRDEARDGRFAHRGERTGKRRMALRGGFGGHSGVIRLADADKDGAITRAEFQAAALTRFDRLDADKDGAVTRE
jgi:hypothetical protein